MNRIHILIAALTAVILSGCAFGSAPPLSSQAESGSAKQMETETTVRPTEITTVSAESVPETAVSHTDLPPQTMPCPDWASYFGELNGAAVIFDPDENTFYVYNENLADTRRSPCSTFKIISSLVGLESGAVHLEDSLRPWSGETFWNDNWNRDIDFPDAFRTSCVWYYRQVIDDIGPDAMQNALDVLQYGNCDISDWEGRLNTNNRNPALTGFWIESSLKISPREQTRVLERIFGRTSQYSPGSLAVLKEVMFLPEASHETCSIYGKTGMGKAGGITVDSWYAGFADIGRRIYFCVYLGETDGQNVSSTLAKEIAVSLVKDNFSESQ